MAIMKKLIILIFIFCLLILKATYLLAQTPEATFVTGNSLRKNDIIRLQIKDDLKLTDAKFDSVTFIQKDYQNKFRQVNQDKKLTEIIKQKHLKDLADSKNKRLKAAGLDDGEVKKVETYFLHKYFP